MINKKKTVPEMNQVKCIGCGGLFPDKEGPVHRYMESCPGCWEVYGTILAREYSDPDYYPVHRMSVDCYAIQHPGTPSPQSIQSVGTHLIRLSLFLEGGLNQNQANNAMLKAIKQKENFVWLEPPESRGEITVIDVVDANSAKEHIKLVKQWAESAWEAWSIHHSTVKSWMRYQICPK